MMKMTVAILAAAFATALTATGAQAADPAKGQALYEVEPDPAEGEVLFGACSSCHGDKGVSIAPIYPNLAGQKEPYLVQQLKAFRDGTRKDPIMTPAAKHLSNIDIAHLASYLARLKP